MIEPDRQDWQWRDDWFTPRRFAVLLGLLVFLLYPDVILGWKTFFHHDFGIFGYPLAHYHRESFWRGEMPLWNPLNYGGVPFMAQWNTMALYPPSLFYLLLPMPWSLCVFNLLHLYAGGLGMYFLARQWTGKQFAASAAGIAFTFSGLALSMLVWPSNGATYGWMPWVLLAVENAWEKGRKGLLWATAAGALQMLTGSPETILFTWVIAGSLLLARMFRAPERWAMFGRFLLLVILVAGVCALQLLPFLELLAQSHRAGGTEVRFSLPDTGWANFLIPLFRCDELRSGVFFQPNQGWINSYYAGIGVLALALAAMWRLRDRRVTTLAVLSILGILLALGSNGFLYPLVRSVFPGVGAMNYPVKFIVLTVFSLPLLAAFAIARLQSSAEESGKLWRTLSIVSGSCVIVMLGLLALDKTFPLYLENWMVTLQNALSRMAMIALLGGILFCAQRKIILSPLPWLPLAFLVLLFVDAVTHAPRQNPTTHPSVLQVNFPHSDLAPPPRYGESRAWIDPLTQKTLFNSHQKDPQSHYIGLRLLLFLNMNLLDDVSKVDGFFPMVSTETDEFMDWVQSTNFYRPGVLDFLGVSHVPDREKILEWKKRDSWMPMITAGQRPIFVPPADQSRALFAQDFNPRQMVILPDTLRNSVVATNQSTARVLQSRWANTVVEADVEAESPAWVVVSQAYYRSWKAYVDGNPVPLRKANFAFQALEIPAGRHQVKLVYEDQAWFRGKILSVLSLAACFALWIRFRRVSTG